MIPSFVLRSEPLLSSLTRWSQQSEPLISSLTRSDQQSELLLSYLTRSGQQSVPASPAAPSALALYNRGWAKTFWKLFCILQFSIQKLLTLHMIYWRPPISDIFGTTFPVQYFREDRKLDKTMIDWLTDRLTDWLTDLRGPFDLWQMWVELAPVVVATENKHKTHLTTHHLSTSHR